MDAKKPTKASIVNKPKVKISHNRPPGQDSSLFQEEDKKLLLNSSSVRPSKTRGEMYEKLKKDSDGLEDIFELPTEATRLLALLVDLGVIGAVAFYSLKNVTAISTQLSTHLGMASDFGLGLNPDYLNYLIVGVITFIFCFFYLVIPTAFLNFTLGKKIFGLNVRGDDSYVLKLNQAFEREFFWKPLSICTLLGFIMPFFDKKKRKSLHDRISKTFVIKA